MKSEKMKPITVPALEKALDIIEFLAANQEGYSLKNLSDKLDIPTASTFRIIKNMARRGYVREYPAESGKYMLGLKFMHINSMLLNQVDLLVQAKPIMKNLSKETNQIAQLGILQEFEVTYLMQEMPNVLFNLMTYPHISLPVNISAAGKVLVAHLSEKEQKEFLKNCKLPPQVKNTITNKEDFKKELDKVRTQAYAFDDEEYGEGIGCLSVPVFDFSENCIAAIGITGPYATFKNKEKRNELLEKVKKAGNALSKELGYNIQ
jgi:DNA-binding IclR family transcriptional regulator